MTTFTVVATIATDRPQSDIEGAVRGALAAIGAELVPCGWAPDRDTIIDNIDADDVTIIDLNPVRVS